MATRALLVSAMLLIGLPATAGAATVSVEPSADMVTFVAAPREENVVTVAAERSVTALDDTPGRQPGRPSFTAATARTCSTT